MCLSQNFSGIIQLVVAVLWFLYFFTEPVAVLSDYYVKRGGDITLNCSVDSPHNISLVIWKKPNGTQIPLSAAQHVSPNFLPISNLTFGDSGNYTCSAYSLDGEVYNENITVVVTDVPDPPVNVSAYFSPPTSLNISWITGSENSSPVLLHTLYIYEDDILINQKNVSAPLHATTVSGLKSGACYNIILRALNDVGWSLLSRPTSVITFNEKIVHQPLLSVQNVSAASVVLYSDHSILPKRTANLSMQCKSAIPSVSHNLPPLEYVIYVSAMEPYQMVAKNTEPVSKRPNQLILVDHLEPYSRYNLSVTFRSGHVESPRTEILIRTLEGLPSPPLINSSSSTNSSIYVQWKDAEKFSGILVGYKLELYPCPANTEEEPNASLRLRMQEVDASRKDFTFHVLDANVCYAVRIAAATKAGFGQFSGLKPVHTDVRTPVPPKLISASFLESNDILLNWTCSGPCVNYVEPSQLSYIVCWSTLTSSWHPSCLRTQTTDTGHGALCHCESPTRFHTTTLPWSIVQHSPSEQALFTVRSVRRRSVCQSGVDCEKESVDSNAVSLDLRAASTSRFSMHFGSRLDGMAIMGIVAIAMFIFSAVSLGACLATRLQCNPIHCHRYLFGTHSAEVPKCKYRRTGAPLRFNKTTYKPLLASDLNSHVATAHANNDAGFQAEFETIEQAVSTGEWTTHVAKLPENAAKNRYSNVLAYDHTRVILKETNGKSDYINANYIDGYHRRAAYIAAQGPTPATFDDFWLMVWEQASNVIVMISNFVERGRRKCDKYWPSNGQHLYGSICVRAVSETTRAFFTTRVFAIRHVRCKRSMKERLVYHYQYTDWRDFDVPLSPLPVLKFVEASIAHWTLEDGPIVVHCSAGVGRTGTYICIESLIRQLKAEKLVTIRGFLEHIRRQRMKLVQTEQQYAFVHDALCEYVLNPCHVISPMQFSDHLSRMRALDSSGRTNLEKQFEMCVERQINSPLHSANTSMRRRGSCSVFGSPITELLGINASPLHGYHTLSEYIIARHPLAGTETEFWKMVWDENSSVIVCLSSPGLPPFWPTSADEVRTIGWLHVSYAGCSPSDNNNLLTRYEFLITSDREDYALVCCLWQVNEWSAIELEPNGDCKLARTLLTLVSQLTDEYTGGGTGADEGGGEMQSSCGPIVVVDDTAGHRAGLFCALRILINQFIHEYCFDVYFVFKMLCVQRPGIFQSYRDLELIYILLEHFLAGSDDINPMVITHPSPGILPSVAYSDRLKTSMVNTLFSHRNKSRRLDRGETSFTALLPCSVNHSSPVETNSPSFESNGQVLRVSSVTDSSELMTSLTNRSQSDHFLSRNMTGDQPESSVHSLPVA